MISLFKMMTALSLPCTPANSNNLHHIDLHSALTPPSVNTNEELCSDWSPWRLELTLTRSPAALARPTCAAPFTLNKRQTERFHALVDAELKRLARGEEHDHDALSSVLLSLCRSRTLQDIFLRTYSRDPNNIREIRSYITRSWHLRYISAWQRAQDSQTTHIEELGGAVTLYEDINIPSFLGVAEEAGLPINPADVMAWCESDDGLRWEANFNAHAIDFLLDHCNTKERQIFLLRGFYDLNSRDVAELLGGDYHEALVNTHLFKLRQRMSKYMSALGYHNVKRAPKPAKPAKPVKVAQAAAL